MIGPLVVTSLEPLCNEGRNPPGSALLVFRVRRIRRDGKLPGRPVSLALDLAHPHRAHHGLITDFNIRIDAQIVHPTQIEASTALLGHDAAAAVWQGCGSLSSVALAGSAWRLEQKPGRVMLSAQTALANRP